METRSRWRCRVRRPGPDPVSQKPCPPPRRPSLRLLAFFAFSAFASAQHRCLSLSHSRPSACASRDHHRHRPSRPSERLLDRLPLTSGADPRDISDGLDLVSVRSALCWAARRPHPQRWSFGDIRSARSHRPPHPGRRSWGCARGRSDLWPSTSPLKDFCVVSLLASLRHRFLAPSAGPQAADGRSLLRP